MKVLIVCEKIRGYGGWYTYARDLRDALRARGHTVVTCGRKGTPDVDHAVLCAPLSMMTSPWKASLHALTLAKILRREKPDVVHIVVEPYALMIPFLPKRWRSRAVLTVHGSYGIRPIDYPLSRPLARKYYAQIPAFITVSAYTKNAVLAEMQKRGWESEHFETKATVVQNGIRVPPREVRTRDGRDAIRKILLVGSVKPRKGVLEAVAACAAYKKLSKSPFVFEIAGSVDESDYVKAVRTAIDKAGLGGQVQFLGPVDDTTLDQLYKRADVFLMPASTTRNTFEGFGLVYIEANARGVPVIGPDTSGAAEAIAEGKSGYRVDPNNPEQMAERVRWILDEHKIAAADCRAWAEEHDIAAMAPQIEKVYGTLTVID